MFWHWRISCGSAFHSVGAAAANDLSPQKALGMRLFNTLNARIEYKYNDIILMLVTGDLKQNYSAIIV